MPVQIKRIYEQASDEDGIRILVDRIWPRGVSKEAAQLDDWLKSVGPSAELRKWFGHHPARFDMFRQKYQEELADGEQHDAFQKLQSLANEQGYQLTLVFAAKDETHNQAQVLKELLDRQQDR